MDRAKAINFNSIKVRLEQVNMTNYLVVSVKFQFHKGTIRTPASLVRPQPG